MPEPWCRASGGDVGGVGLQHQGIDGQLGRQAAQLQGAVVGHGATKTQPEAHGDERLCLLQAAVEGVRNAALHRQLAQPLEQPVGRAAHMQDHWQVKSAGQLELCTVKPFLPSGIQAGHEEVQPDFAHRYQPWVRLVLHQRLLQRLQVFIRRPARVEGVDAQGVAVFVLVRHGAHRVPVAALHRRNHAVHHPLSSGRPAHGVPVCIELGGVKVAMGVDPDRHGRMMP